MANRYIGELEGIYEIPDKTKKTKRKKIKGDIKGDGIKGITGREEASDNRVSNPLISFLLFIFASASTAVVLFVVFFLAAVFIIARGPSEEAKRLFVLSLHETSALKRVPYYFIPEKDVDEILYPAEIPVQTDDFVEFTYENASAMVNTAKEGKPEVDDSASEQQEPVEIIDVKGASFKGKLMIVKDPSRVMVGVLDAYGADGLYLKDFVSKYRALGAVNGGGFYDPEGQGTGGIPDGMVIGDGRILYGNPGAVYNNLIGFDGDHVLHVVDATGNEALELGLVSAVSFPRGPILIQNGVRRENLGGGVNPRTCVGQRSDGAVVLCVIEGRHPSSLGATYDDLAILMEKYGCVNAGNLDGGSSSSMIYDGEYITRGSNLIGSRRMPTAFIILP